jgi:hypothetical protein
MGIETIWGYTFLIPFHIFNIWIQSVKPLVSKITLASKIILATWRKNLHSPPILTSSIFFMATIHLQLLHVYCIMARQKFIGMFPPNTLKIMIEYTLISSILNRICKMTTKPLQYWRDLTLLDPLKNLLEIITWGTKWIR